MKKTLNLNPKRLAQFLILTSVTKDVFAYSLRVKNAKKNEEIPDDKKPFVVAMDKATGITTAVVQIGAGFLVSRTGLGALATLLCTKLLAKRLLTPLIATPLASWMIKKDAKSEEDKNAGLEYLKQKTYNEKIASARFSFKSFANFK